jgi:hypothetical protein
MIYMADYMPSGLGNKIMTEKQSSWALTKQRSNYHFDNFKFDPDQDRITFLGNISPFWTNELEAIKALAQPKTWRTRGQGADRPSEEYDQEDYDLEQFGYGRDHVMSDLTWDVPEIFNKLLEQFDMENSKMRLHVQRPGQTWNLHLDKLDKWNPADPSRVMRIMIALTDYEPGHFFSYGNYIHTGWRAGDVYTFDWRNIPHSTANAGHGPRVTLQITGIRTAATMDYLALLSV